MRKYLILAVGAWLALGVAAAFAEVTVTATITKDKFVGNEAFTTGEVLAELEEDLGLVLPPEVVEVLPEVLPEEVILKEKDVLLFITVDADVDKAAESLALINQVNDRNEACENCAEKRDEIINSVLNHGGVVTVNQAAGNMNNQGAAISVAVDVSGTPDPTPESSGFAEAQASVDQRNGTVDTNTVDSLNILFRDAVIKDSINENNGIVAVNQSPGNMNNQANAVSIAISLEGGVALAESDLGQLNTGNLVIESGPVVDVTKSATITRSVVGNFGVVHVNQSAGNMANQANILSFAAAFAGP